jgi:hypothetical protein
MTDEIEFELWYGPEGVSITEYDTSEPEWTVKEEWWFTWTELFTRLTGENKYSPSIHSQ